MKLSRIAILGGGPGGLFAGRLLKIRHPHAEVDVYEQNSPDETFGFGVGLPAGAQRNLSTADPDTVETIEKVGRRHDAAMSTGTHTVRFADFSTIAIGRSELLRVLRDQAAKVGVQLHFGDRVLADKVDADLIVAADGVSSATRERYASEFGADVRTSSGLYLWCGTDFALEHAVFEPRTTNAGTFVVHAYPYANDASTFLIETDENTWRTAGLDSVSSFDEPQDSDERSLTYLQEVFSEVLGGRPLVGNRTRWLRFRTVRCKTWHHQNVVLLGDAAHTAHYSIGSGTKLAMEDAIALDLSLARATSLPEALSDYVDSRRRHVSDLQDVARRSELWWETFPERIDMPIERLMLAYMTRAGKVSLDRFLTSTPEIARRALAQYADTATHNVSHADTCDWVLGRPLHHRAMHSPTRRFGCGPQFTDVDAFFSIDARQEPNIGTVAALALSVSSGGLWADNRRDYIHRAGLDSRGAVWLHGSDERADVLDRLEIGDDIRRQTTKMVAVSAPSSLRADLVAALASGRIDVAIETSERGNHPLIAHRLRL